MRSVALWRVLGAALLLAPLACQPSTPSATAAAPTSDIAYVRIPRAHLSKDFVHATGFNRDHVHDAVYAFGYLQRSVLESLPTAVFQDVVELDAEAWAHHRFDPRTLEPIDEPEPRTALAAEGFHDYPALTTEVQNLAGAHPDLVALTSAGKSVEGRELWLLKISANVAQDDGRPKLLYIANMHGDETVGRELMIYLARQLATGYGTDQRITSLLDAAQIYIMPSMNPDGYEHRRRENARGVDLNRDFPDFTADPHDTPSGRAVETQAIMALHQQHHFIMAINFHGGDVVFNLPWDTQENDDPKERFGDVGLLQGIGRQYADLNATMQANDGDGFDHFDHGMTYGYEWYEVDGGMQDWSNYYRNSIHATVELSYTKWPAASALPGAWNENKEGLLRYLEQGVTGAHLKVVDDSGQLVTGVTLRVSSADRDVHYATGLLHRPTVAGAQTATVSAAGFKTQTVSFTPTKFDGKTYQTVVLSRQ